MKPKHLLLAPPFVWAAAGVVLFVDGHRALDYFPVLWAANDIAIMIAFAGLMMMLFSGSALSHPGFDEWTGWNESAGNDPSLEQMLVDLARGLEGESLRP